MRAIVGRMIRPGLIHDQLEYFAREPFAVEMERAFREFFGQAPAMIERDRVLRGKLDRHEGLFGEWFLFHFRLASGTTPIELIIDENPTKMSADDIALLRRIRDGHYGFYEIREVNPGIGLLLHDIMRRKNVFVHEVKGSRDVKPRSIILCRVADLGDRHEIVSASVEMFPATFGPRLQKKLRSLMKHGEGTPREAFLLAEDQSHTPHELHDVSLAEAREMLVAAIQQAGIARLVSAETIERWMRDEVFDDVDGPLRALLLLSGDSPDLIPDGAPDALTKAISALSNALPKKVFGGKTPEEARREREQKDEGPQWIVEETPILPINIGDYQRRGTAALGSGNQTESIRINNDLLTELLARKIVFREPFRIIANQGVAYLFDGDRDMGERMLEAAHTLNPHYGFAAAQLERLHSGELDASIEAGRVRFFERRFGEGGILNRWTPDRTRSMKTGDLLCELEKRGVSVTEEGFRAQAAQSTSVEDIAHGPWERSFNGPEEDADILWTAALALWERWLPDDPAPDLLATWFDDLEDCVDDMPESGTQRMITMNKWRKAFARIEAAFAQPSPHMKDRWKVWHEKYTDDDPDTITYALTRSLFFAADEGEEYRERVRALAMRICDSLFEQGLDAVLIACEMQTNGAWDGLYKTLLVYCETSGEYGPLWILGGYAEERDDAEHAICFYNDARTIASRKLERTGIPTDRKALHACELTLEHLSDLCGMIEEITNTKTHTSLIQDIRATRRIVAARRSMLRKLPLAKRGERDFAEIMKTLIEDRYEKTPAARYLAWLSSLGINYDFETVDKMTVWRMDGDRNKRLGRNDPCQCGSGKKYKKCCL